jgi:hypothetical protein
MKETIVVPFAVGAGDQSLDLEVDEERTGSTTPAPGGILWLRAWTDGQITVRGATRGRIMVEGTRLREELIEDVVFADEKVGSLPKAAARVVSQEWLGLSLGEATVSGKDVVAGEQGYGILRVVYEAAYALLKVTGVSVAGPVLIWAQDSLGASGYLAVDFEEGEEGERDVYVVVKDFCTDLPIAEAQIWVDGALYGPTGPDGRVYIGKRVKGARCALKMAASQYRDSDLDALANDAFEVQ